MAAHATGAPGYRILLEIVIDQTIMEPMKRLKTFRLPVDAPGGQSPVGDGVDAGPAENIGINAATPS
ncbi:MAG: hypothetical protein OXG56_12810 [Gammaproteobacteria bacterium]|nr:hypothetical protein [Gammaproteobacteria bacterium]